MANHPAAWLSSPPSWFFSFPPNAEPQALAPQTAEGSLATPFSIDPELYSAVLRPQVPVTFAICYMSFVLYMNRRNRRRQYRPYSFSRSRLFYYFTILHNTSLALYSGVTCFAMGYGMYKSVKSPLGPEGLPGTVDSLCKINGPAGFGRAVTFDPNSSSWQSKSGLMRLSKDGLTPSSGDFGRMWNEGLAFWGWFFYLSKFYEVIDTLLILSKGKRSATLQTYHHAGAMLCMWAGIRYMSPPIWMFVVVNSGIHTLMYTYYTVNGLGVKVPQQLKRTLTTMQIMQFLVGATYASFHLFVGYSAPVSLPRKIAKSVPSIPSAVSSAAASATSAAVAGSLWESWVQGLQEMVAMVAGSPGIARKVHETQQRPSSAGIDAVAGSRGGFQAARDAKQSAKYSIQHEPTRCLDTSGQAFAIWLNVFYLMPLTVLFVRFFVKSYIFGDSSRTGRKVEREKSRRVSESIDAAARDTSAAVEGLGRHMEQSMDLPIEETAVIGTEVEEELDRTIEEIKRQGKASKKKRSAFIKPESLKPVD